MTPGEDAYNTKELIDFRKIFDQYYDGIRNFIYYKTGDIDLADDIVQEVFLKVWNIRTQVKPETVKALLYTIAENITKNYFRHQQVVYNFASNYVHEEKMCIRDSISTLYGMCQADHSGRHQTCGVLRTLSY